MGHGAGPGPFQKSLICPRISPIYLRRWSAGWISATRLVMVPPVAGLGVLTSLAAHVSPSPDRQAAQSAIADCGEGG